MCELVQNVGPEFDAKELLRNLFRISATDKGDSKSGPCKNVRLEVHTCFGANRIEFEDLKEGMKLIIAGIDPTGGVIRVKFIVDTDLLRGWKGIVLPGALSV